MTTFEARYNDGVTARTHTARAELTDKGLDIYATEGGLLDSWAGGDVRTVDRGAARGAIRLTVGEDSLARLTIDDPLAPAAIMARFPDAARGHRISPRTMGRIAGWTAVFIAGLAFLVWVVIPAAAVQVAGMIPQSVQREIGKKVSEQLIQIVAFMEKKRVSDMRCTGGDGVAALEALTSQLTAQTPSNIEFRIGVLDAQLVNAVALPGGHILLTKGILNFVKGPNELAGVLGHEMGHVALNHAVENMIKVGGISALFSMLVGDVAGGAVIVAVGQSLIRGSFSQQAERAADGFAVRLMKKSELNSRPFANFFERLAEMHGKARPKESGRVMDWVSSHPPTLQRAETVRRTSTPGGTVLTDQQWQALRNICG